MSARAPATSDDERAAIRRSVGVLCERFGNEYWRRVDKAREYPTEFVDSLTKDGWLSMLVPEHYGGMGLGVTEAAVVLQEINRSGGNSSVAHAQMYVMGALLRHGSDQQKADFLPSIATGKTRLQAFAVTEPDAGSDTTRISTRAEPDGDGYRISGTKVFISRAEHTDLMLLIARTTPYAELDDKTLGLSLFLIDVATAQASGGMVIRPIDMMFNHHTTEVILDDLHVPGSTLVGKVGEGFRYILDGWNAERILIAAECIGDADWFIERASSYASSREVFGRPLGANQGVQFPIARAYANVRAAELMTYRAAALFDSSQRCGAEANMAKLLASEGSWQAANACLDSHGGYGFAVEYDIERKFRETRLYTVAPVNNNLILSYLAQHVLAMPRSY